MDQMTVEEVHKLVAEARRTGLCHGIEATLSANGDRDTRMGREMCDIGVDIRATVANFAQRALAEQRADQLRKLVVAILQEYLATADGLERVGLILMRPDRIATA